jgi:hypothetical protein
MNHTIHVAATNWLRLDRRPRQPPLKRAEGMKPLGGGKSRAAL